MREALAVFPLFVALLAAGTLNQAQADLIEWKLNNGNFADGGSITGSFVWDTVLNESVSWNFNVAGGDTATFAPFTYSESLANHDAFDSSVIGGAPRMSFFDTSLHPFSLDPPANNNRREIRFGLSDLNLLNTPIGMLALVPTGLPGTVPNGLLECYNCAPFRVGLEGAYLSAVPVPAALWLFGTALVGFVGIGRRRKPG